MLNNLLLVSVVLMLCAGALAAVWTAEKIVTITTKKLVKIIKQRTSK